MNFAAIEKLYKANFLWMINEEIKQAFGIDGETTLQKLSTGLINYTYKITDKFEKSFLLQELNQKIFPQPIIVQNNYLKIQQHLAKKGSFVLPDIISTKDQKLVFENKNTFWRCFEFIPNTYSPSVSSDAKQAWQVANCFGKFSADLDDLNSDSIFTILPRFHDLQLRFEQFQDALKNASVEKINNAKTLIDNALNYKNLVHFYNKIIQYKKEFPLHILHHDCKIANILFKSGTNEIYGPIDLDTTQPGLFFSDLGDMIRSIVPNFSENETELDKIVLRADFYQAVKDGYLQAMQKYFTKEELVQIDMAGKIVIYMQALRFLTDYLSNDIYYHTDYAEQNKDRAANQFKLLELLNVYINSLSNKKIYIG